MMPPLVPWSFSYSQPHDLLLFAHLALDAYDGTGAAATAHIIRAPQGWTPVLTTDDGTSPKSIDATTGRDIAAVFDTSSDSPHMQATAYREDATGRVVIAYRGTDDGNGLFAPPLGELLDTSVPLGLGLGENPLLGVHTVSYLQSAVDFYAALVDTGIDPADISFAGHSLGGIVAGYMAGATSSQGMIFASGPHNILVRNLDSAVVKPAGHGFLTGAPDYSGLVNARIDGEVLGAAIEAAAKGTLYQFVLSTVTALATGGVGSPLLASFSTLAASQWGDARVEGTHLPELLAGSGTRLGAIDLHAMALHELILYGDYGLGLSAYKTVPGFIAAFYDDKLAASAEGVAGPGLFDHSADHLRSDMLLAIQDGRENVLHPLLDDAEHVLAPLKAIPFGLIGSNGRSNGFISALSAHFVEMAATALLDAGIDYSTAIGLSHGGSNSQWLRLALDSFGPDTPSQGVREMADLVLRLIDRAPTEALHFIDPPGEARFRALVNAAHNLDLISDPGGGGGSLMGSDANDLVVGAVLAGGRGVSVNGGGGNDVLVGSAADDVLRGGAGDNLLVGLAGDDRYVASGVAGARTTVSDLGGNDTLFVGGDITGGGKTSYRYVDNVLSLSIGARGASLDVLDFFNAPAPHGAGHIETIEDIHGQVWRPATMLENAAAVVTHKLHSVSPNVNVLVTTASDAVDRVVGTIDDFAARQVRVVGHFGPEDVVRIAGSMLRPDMVDIGSGALTARIDTNLDGIADAAFTLAGDYTGYRLVMKTDPGGTTFRVVGDPDMVFDLHGSDAAGDTITGTSAGESIGGLGGDDLLRGQQGRDHLDGGSGNDTLGGGRGGDVMLGGKGNDLFFVDNARDVVIEFAGEGHDTVRSSVSFTLATRIETLNLLGHHRINGAGNALDNTIIGNVAGNHLYGGAGGDTLRGQDGNDTLAGGAGADIVDGGRGRDSADYATSAGGISVSLLSGHGIGGDAAGDTLIGIENLKGSAANDSLRGDGANNVLKGGAGGDRLAGGGGDDRLFGGAGHDTLIGGMGSDSLNGSHGIDTADYSASPAAVAIDLATGAISGGHAAGDILISIENLTGSSGGDSLTGDGNANRLGGRAGNDTLTGALGKDTLHGGSGNDRMFGGAGHDVLDGGAGFDTLKGGNGADRLNGDSGGDLLTGGKGADTFVFAAAFGHDTITDFAPGDLEHIDLSRLGGIGDFADLIAHHLFTDPGGTGFAFIDDGAGDTILLDGVTVGEIGVGKPYSGADFLF